jgi:hypothetical protein
VISVPQHGHARESGRFRLEIERRIAGKLKHPCTGR